MQQYLDLLKEVLAEGEIQRDSRTGVVRLGLLGAQRKFYLDEGFPIVTTKQVGFNWVADELFWKLQGNRDAHSLYVGRGVDIWNRNAFQKKLEREGNSLASQKNTPRWEEEFLIYQESMKSPNFDPVDSDLGPVYGFQIRHWTRPDGKEVDQLKNLLDGLKSPNKKYGTYNFMTTLNAGEVQDMAIAPCPFGHVFSAYGDNVDSACTQRSCDVELGVPFNITQESLLLAMVARETGLKPRKFTHQYWNLHTYAGVPPRSDFITNQSNLANFQKRFKKVDSPEGYLELRDWYLKNAPEESLCNERKDHIPFMLMQLSKPIHESPKLVFKTDLPLLDLITKKSKEVVAIEGYTSEKWDSRAVMAA